MNESQFDTLHDLGKRIVENYNKEKELKEEKDMLKASHTPYENFFIGTSIFELRKKYQGK